MKKARDYMTYIAIVAIVAGVVFFPGGLYDRFIAEPKEPATQPTQPGVVTTIAPLTIKSESVYTGQNTLDLITRDVYNPNTIIDLCCYIEVNGVRLTDIASTGTADVTANTKDVISGYCGGDETSDGDLDCQTPWGQNGTADWYFKPFRFTVGNEEQSKLTVDVVPEDSTRPTMIVYSDDGISKVSSAGTNQTVATGKNYKLKVWYSATSEKDYGTPKSYSGLTYTGINCAEYNRTIFDDVQLRYFGKSEELPIASSPRLHTTVAANTSTCWYMPDEYADANDQYYTLFLDMDDTDTPAAGSIRFTHYDVGSFIHADTGKFTYGVEDEKGNDVGQTTNLGYSVNYNA